MPAPAVQHKNETVSALDRLAQLAADLRAMAATVEDIALDVAQEIQRIGADSEKLRQLQALLKGLGN